MQVSPLPQKKEPARLPLPEPSPGTALPLPSQSPRRARELQRSPFPLSPKGSPRRPGSTSPHLLLTLPPPPRAQGSLAPSPKRPTPLIKTALRASRHLKPRWLYAPGIVPFRKLHPSLPLALSTAAGLRRGRWLRAQPSLNPPTCLAPPRRRLLLLLLLLAPRSLFALA